MMAYKGTSISSDGTHHIKDGKPMYEKRFEDVQSFHEPGIAAVKDDSGAYHIDMKGVPVYEKRFKRTFGFYEGFAAVEDETGWYHIKEDGFELYYERYRWVGNFQEGRCPVRDISGDYYHIDTEGKPVYDERYQYVGDYRYGVAVVYDEDGAKHIDKDGNEIHTQRYRTLGKYHKGFATARDEEGALHVDEDGKPIYDRRFRNVEPFYNGQAFAETKDRKLVVVNENGKILQHVISFDRRKELMDILVGYWNTQILYCVVRSGILEKIDLGEERHELYDTMSLPRGSVDMLIDLCRVWGLIEKRDSKYRLGQMGRYLLKDHRDSLHHAALMWGGGHYRVMSRLWDALKTQEPQFEKMMDKSFFDHLRDNEEASRIYSLAISEYSDDYLDLIDKLPLEDATSVMDIGGGLGDLLRKILDEFRGIEEGVLFELPNVIEQATEELEDQERLRLVEGDFFLDELPECDSVVASRIIHDWSGERAVKILKNVERSLPDGGKLILLEMVKPEDPEEDFGVSLSFDLLVTVGGKERTEDEFRALGKTAGLELKEVIHGDGIISALVFEKRGR